MITPVFEAGYEIVAELEGGFSDNPYDRGGATMYGITESVARAYGYQGEMKDLPKPLAKEIFKNIFWDKIRLDEVKDDLLAQLMLDASINHGQARAVIFAQQAYNVLSSSPIKVDGIIGTQTLKALNGYPHPFMLKLWYLIVRGRFFREIVKNDSSQKTFIRGWTNRLDRWFKELYKEQDKTPTRIRSEDTLNVDYVIDEIIRRLSK